MTFTIHDISLEYYYVRFNYIPHIGYPYFKKFNHRNNNPLKIKNREIVMIITEGVL
jgi:hypothetical protein